MRQFHEIINERRRLKGWTVDHVTDLLEQHLLAYAGIDRELVAVRAGKYWRLIAK